jgi:hypothetical protein
MRIYHYTSIQTLALILKYRKIRFNRLDRVDDLEESIYGSGSTQTKLAKYTFVSCWTKSGQENLALWNMYTQYKGVRIGLDEMPFKTFRVNEHFSSLLPNPMSLDVDSIMSSFINEAKLYDINYVDDPETEIKKLIMSTGNGFVVHTDRLGTYKRKEWSMQQESRFKITVLPADALTAVKEASSNQDTSSHPFLYKMFESLGPSIKENKPINATYIDLELDPEKLADIEIMMGPLSSESDRIIVESLLSPYPQAKIINSFFCGKLQEKN